MELLAVEPTHLEEGLAEAAAVVRHPLARETIVAPRDAFVCEHALAEAILSHVALGEAHRAVVDAYRFDPVPADDLKLARAGLRQQLA